LPVAVANARVADDVEQRLVLAKLLDLDSKSVGDVARARLVLELLGELVHRAKHIAHLQFDRLGVLLLKRTCERPTFNVVVVE